MKQKLVRNTILLFVILGLLTAISTSLALSDGGYTLDWFKVAGCGGTMRGDTFDLTGTIGQAEAGKLSGGSYSLSGNFLTEAVSGYKLFTPLSKPPKVFGINGSQIGGLLP